MRKPTSQEILKQSLKDLMRSTSFDSICIQDILNESHISRRTFYKYFYNKEGLLEYTLYEDLFKHNFYDFSRPLGERKCEMLETISLDKPFYLQVLSMPLGQTLWQTHGTRSLYEYFLGKETNIPSSVLQLTCSVISAGAPQTNLSFLNGSIRLSADNIGSWHEEFVEGSIHSLRHISLQRY